MFTRHNNQLICSLTTSFVISFRRRRQNIHHKASERDASLLADSSEPTYITSQRLVPESSYTVKVPDYSQTATYAAAPAVCGHRTCEVVHQHQNATPYSGSGGTDDGPDVIYPRRITLPLASTANNNSSQSGTVTGAPNQTAGFPSLKTFRNNGGGQYEPATRTIGGGVNTTAPVYHVFTGVDDEFELHELHKIPSNSQATLASNDKLTV